MTRRFDSRAGGRVAALTTGLLLALGCGGDAGPGRDPAGRADVADAASPDPGGVSDPGSPDEAAADPAREVAGCICGNGRCEPACGETLESCPSDCHVCGDGTCSPTESPKVCPEDCCKGPKGSGCGDGICRGYACGEGPSTCPQDCGTPCGNGVCEPGETSASCEADCAWQTCGNGVCEPLDGGPEACPQDCDTPCGDCICAKGEDWLTCPVDCGFCGDHVCSPCGLLREDTDTCLVDCPLGCEPGFFDLNGSPADGCECHRTSDVDLPDPLGSDGNCDGIDGEVSVGVFVARSGSDTDPGTIDHPLRTIQTGIEKAFSSGARDVYVATGLYPELVNLRKGIGVYGGYSADFRVRSADAYQTVVIDSVPTPELPGAVNAIGISGGTPGSTVFAGFVVFGYRNRAAGGSSIAVYLRDSDATVTFRENRIVAGDAGNGVAGAAGSSGAAGVAGESGKTAYDIGEVACTTDKESPGGTGGRRTCANVDVGGGTGGRAVCPVWDESRPDCPSQTVQTTAAAENGGAGANGGATGGLAGQDAFQAGQTYSWVAATGTCTKATSQCTLCLTPDASKSGGDGQPGSPGQDGPAPAACVASGRIVDARWVPGRGADASAGVPGGGGGGGGAAGGVDTRECATQGTPNYPDIGGSGGGGGSGGCGGSGGGGGGNGGGSFGMFVVFTAPPESLPDIRDSRLEPGRGGDGGNGGIGGFGGGGGAGAAGGLEAAGETITFCTSRGGNGGNGGGGGNGAGGAGGCGGPAYGLFVSGAAGFSLEAYRTANLVFANSGLGGLGGAGGASLGNAGPRGADGETDSMNF